MIRKFFAMSAALALVAISAAFQPTQAAAQVSSEDGAAFIGAWALPLNAQGQAFTIEFDIVDNDGVLAATVGGFEGGEEDIDDIFSGEIWP